MPRSEEQRQKRREYMRNRYANNPEVRQRVSETNRIHYYANLDEHRQRSSDYYRSRKTDPEFKKKVNAGITRNRFKRLYGITSEERDAILVSQENKCAICKRFKTKWWHIDHCHKTGKVRGILCHRCNVMIGMAREDIDVLNTAIDYLRR